MKTGDIIKLRHATRDLSLYMNEKLDGYLKTLEANFYPSAVLGRYIRSAKNVGSKQHDEVFEKLAIKFAEITQDAPYSFTKTLEAPIDIFSALPAIYPWTYQKTLVDSRGSAKGVQITTPGKWVLGYEGFDTEFFASQMIKREKIIGKELKDFVIHHLIMAEIVQSRGDIRELLEDLRFTAEIVTLEDFGELPFVIIESDVQTFLPDDGIVLEITEISGSDNFEELVDVNALQQLEDGFLRGVKDKLSANGFQLTKD